MATKNKLISKNTALKAPTNRICNNVNTIENNTLESIVRKMNCCDVDKCQSVKIANMMEMYQGLNAHDKSAVINRICNNVNSIGEAASTIDPANIPAFIKDILIKYDIGICDLFRIYQEWEIMNDINNMSTAHLKKLDDMAKSLGYQ